MQQSRAPYYVKLHLGDYARDADHLSMLQEGAYFRLMRWYYSTAKPLPNDLERIYRRCMAFSLEEQQSIKYVLEEFFLLDGPVWRHKRIEEELEVWTGKSAGASEAVKRRWEKLSTASQKNAHENNEIQHTNVIRPLYQPEPEPEPELKPKIKTLMSGLPKKQANTDASKRILEFLNETAGKRFRSTKVNLGFIEARLDDGISEDDLRKITVRKCRDWLPDDKMREYLQPKTLFNRTNCEQYLGNLIPPGKEKVSL